MSCRSRWSATLAALSLMVSACSGSLIDSRGSTELTLSLRGQGGAQQAAAGLLPASVDLAAVDRLIVTVTRVEFLPAEADEEANGAWISLDIDDVSLDLMALPTDPLEAITLVTGDLPAGEYGMLRLYVSEATIWFNSALQLGQAFTYQADTPYPVFIPSADQTGIKTDQGFTVVEGPDEVVLLFDANTTLANVTGTGNGTVIMAPVLRVADE